MAELSTLARPYARAVFEYADHAGDLQGWSEMLATAAAVSQQETVARLLSSPVYTTAQQIDKMIEILGDSLSAAGGNLLRTLAANRRLALLPEINRQFIAYKANREKAVDVDVVSAGDIDAALQIKLAEALSARLDREVNLQVSVDKSLIGGAVIRAGDTIIDGSIRGRLGKLAEALIS